MQAQRISLANGLTLGMLRVGAAGGVPAFYFHGLPGSCLEVEIFHHAAATSGIDLIAVERFGYGESGKLKPEPEVNGLQVWANTIEQLADALGIQRFYQFAVSGGSPYALACASYLAERVIASTVVCGLGQVAIDSLRQQMRLMATMAFDFARHHPMLLSLVYGVPFRIASQLIPGRMVALLGKRNPEIDQHTLSQPFINQVMQRAVKRAFMHGIEGAKRDLLIAQQPWPFDLSKIRHLTLWHGDNDPVVPLSHSQWLQQHVPQTVLHVMPGESHFSLPFNQAEKILRDMLDGQ